MGVMDYVLLGLILGYTAYVLFFRKKRGCCGNCARCAGCRKKD